MYAIVETGGKQYRVSPGDTLRVEKLPVERGQEVTLDRVLAIGGDEGLTVGSPVVEGASVLCTVVELDRGKKIVAIRYHAKKNVRVKRGHRQWFSAIRIDDIRLSPAVEAVAAEPAPKKTRTKKVSVEAAAEVKEQVDGA
jgi:large subunit ribosomal protein L21